MMPTMLLGWLVLCFRRKSENLLAVAGEYDSLDLQTARRQLSYKGVADGADGELVEEGPDDHDAACGEGAFAAVGFGDETQESEDE